MGALSQQAERLSAAGPLSVTVEAGELGALPAAVEVAAFRIAGEAMTNVARHAAATRGTVRNTVSAIYARHGDAALCGRCQLRAGSEHHRWAGSMYDQPRRVASDVAEPGPRVER